MLTIRKKKASKDNASISKPHHSAEDLEFIQSVKQIQFVSYTLIFIIFLGFAGLCVYSPSFRSWFPFNGPPGQVGLAVLRVLLAVAVFGLILMWIAATFHELILWINNLQIVFITHMVYVAMILTAVSLGILLLIVWDISLFSGFFSFFYLVNCWSQRLANRYFEAALRSTDRTSENAKVLAAMEQYWLRRPQVARIAIMLLVGLVAFSLGLAGYFATESRREIFYLVAYALMILNIAAGETVIAFWRKRRDDVIEESKRRSKTQSVQSIGESQI